MFWKSNLQLELKSCSLHHVDMVHLSGDWEAIWRIIGVYGYPNNKEKYKTWALLKSLNVSGLPWFCFGDFNEILGQHKKTGNNGKTQALIGDFKKRYNSVNCTIWVTQAMLSHSQTTEVVSKMYKKD